jgi:chemotaxis methyl-accepting protein methylase
MINANTGFFRHPGALGALTRHVLPQLCARKCSEASTPLRIWSAGCATGEEAYSIAMAVSDVVTGVGNPNGGNNGNVNCNGSNGSTGGAKGRARTGGIAEASPGAQSSSQGWSVHIVGSDLLPSAIEVAERGLYPQSAVGGLPPAVIRTCFSKVGSLLTSLNGSQSRSQSECTSAPHLLVKPRLRSLVTFNTMNLARPGYIGRFDCIFCMDVLPQFSRGQRLALLERLHLYLEPGGYLFLGQTEKLAAPNLNFRSETFDGYTFHRKPVAASAAYGR